MAFSNTKLNEFKFGEMDIEFGTFTNDNTAGGDISTGLSWAEAVIIQALGDSVVADQDSINETLPCKGDAITVVTSSNSRNYAYIAIGRK